MRVLITGAKGQLGRCIQVVSKDYSNIEFLFTDAEELDITQKENVEDYFLKKKIDYVVNCAAYTNVELAEKESQKAFLINAIGAKNLAEACKKYNAILIHISTDYVFDGEKGLPYTEEDRPNPINEYGKSKLAGEEYIVETLHEFFIIRTSWLYSQYGHNFFKTILKKSKIEKQLIITTSEIGTPTNANDLARFILKIISSNSLDYGLYHYSNLGEATWYDFAEEILRVSGKLRQIKLEKTDNYHTFAVRPKYSVLSKEKISINFDITIKNWVSSLSKIKFNW